MEQAESTSCCGLVWKRKGWLKSLSEIGIIVLAILSIIYTSVGLDIGRKANHLGEEAKFLSEMANNLARTDYDNSVVNTWATAQASCKENNVCYTHTLFIDFYPRS